jgi:superfamily II DNA or RNA helicase
MKPGFKSRIWQQHTLQRFKELEYNALIQAPTAAGKTVFAMMAISLLRIKHPGLKTTIIVPTINLLNQWKQELKIFLDVPEDKIGIFYGPKKENSKNKEFMIYVINSASRNDNLKKQQSLNPFELVIFDEVHHSGANTHKKLFDITDFQYRLGISATPDREYDDDGTLIMSNFFKNRINVPKEFVEMAPMITNMIRLEFTKEEKRKYEELKIRLVTLQGKLKKQYGLSSGTNNFFKKLTKLASEGVMEAKLFIGTIRGMENIRFKAENKLKIINNLAHNDLDQKTIIFCDRIDFVNRIYSMLRSNYPDREVFKIHSELTKSQQIGQLESFKHGNKGILVAAKIVDEGFDVPDAEIGILVSFTKTKRQTIQRDGRILRFVKGKIAKKYVLVINDVDESIYLDLLVKTDQINSALRGAWYDFKNNEFNIAHDFKANFRISYLNKIINRTDN